MLDVSPVHHGRRRLDLLAGVVMLVVLPLAAAAILLPHPPEHLLPSGRWSIVNAASKTWRVSVDPRCDDRIGDSDALELSASTSEDGWYRLHILLTCGGMIGIGSGVLTRALRPRGYTSR
jgi:hypothetical protein